MRIAITDRNELINDIAELKAKRDRLLAQVKEAEQWESVAWDSYYAVADHVKALEKKQEIGRNYWEKVLKELLVINLTLWLTKLTKSKRCWLKRDMIC